MKKKMPRIQMLRGILFILILAFHSGVPYSDLWWSGVESFFLLSAFFLTKKLFGKNTVSVITQFFYRIKRLYLPYLLLLVMAFLFALLRHRIPYDVVPHLLSGQTFLWIVTDYSSPMQTMTAHTWTLSIDVWVGLIWLIMLKKLSKEAFKKSMYLCLVGAIIIRTASILFGYDPLVLTLNPLSHMDAFALGSILAIELMDESVEKSRMPVICGILGIFGLITSVVFLMYANHTDILTAYTLLDAKEYYLTNPVSGNIFLYIALLFYWVVYCLYKKDNSGTDVYGEGASWLSHLFIYIGDRSYVLYLFHWPVLVVLRYIWNNWLFLLVVGGVISVVVTIIYEKWLEPIAEKLGGNKV